jgi:hypothetical protein
MCAGDERERHNRVGVGKERFVAIAKVETPNLRRGEEGWGGKTVYRRLYSRQAAVRTLMFLSAEPVAIKRESKEISSDITGSLCPYRDRKNLRLSS